MPAQQLLGRQCNRSNSARGSAAAIAAVGAPGASAPSTGALVRRHTNGAVTPVPLYEPTYEDLKPYLGGASADAGVEGLIQRRLQQANPETVPPGAKLGKLPPTQRYMAAIAVQHRHRLQQREQHAAEQP